MIRYTGVMGRLIDGKWSTADLGADAKGRYVRRAAKFRGRISADGSTGFPADSGRYHLYLAYACGWSHRTLIVRALKGLEEVVSFSTMEDFMGVDGWRFEGGSDPLANHQKLYELYLAAQDDYTGRASVPVLWDKQEHRIVSNESTDIIESLDAAFAAFDNGSPSLYPAAQVTAIEEMMQSNYEAINNGVYRCGFAGSQEAYDEAATRLFDRLDALEELLASQRYLLLGEEPTSADWALFPTLYRFDAVYYIHFKCSRRQLRDYANLWAYTRDLYQHSGVRETCKMEHIRAHYYTSHESIHPRRIIPLAPDIDFDEPHGRERK
jgi:putative glutathione S-transferase